MKEPSGVDIIKTRDTNEIYKLAFQYILKNSATLLLPLLTIAIPLIIISEISAMVYVEGYDPFNRIISLKKSLDPKPFLIVLLLFVVYVLGISLYNYFINNCLLKSAKITKNELVQGDRSFIGTFKTYIINFFILYVIFYVVTNTFHHFYSEFLMSIERDPVEGVIGYIWFIVVNKLPWLTIMPPVFFFCFAAGYVSYRDDIGSSEALVKIWSLVKEKILRLWYNSFMVCGVYFGLMLTLKIFLWYARGVGSLLESNYLAFHVVIVSLELLFTLIAMIHLHVSMVLLYGSFEDEAHGQFIKRKVEEL